MNVPTGPAAAWTFLIACGALAADPTAPAPAATSGGAFDVRAYGAVGDGVALDTRALQAALDAAGAAGGGQVRMPPGRYLSGTIHLRSRVTLLLEPGATLVGTSELAEYAAPRPPDVMPEAKWGPWHRGLIVGQNVEEVAIVGPGEIDGARVFDPTGEERMRGPHTIVLVNCRRFTLRDATIRDSANYAVFIQVSDDVDIRNMRFIGGWDGVHWRGAPEQWCRNVRLVGCHFETGDDAIAGRYWDDALITGCTINSSCNGVRLIGPARRLVIHDNLFYGPGAQPHRSSRTGDRNNMLSGILLQPGGWDATAGPLDDVLISGNTMRNVASPVSVWTKPGNTTGRITVSGLRATGVYRAAISVESWAESPLGEFTLEDARIEYVAGDQPPPAAGAALTEPRFDARPLPAWALFARNVAQLNVADCRFTSAGEQLRPSLAAENVERTRLSNVWQRVGEEDAKPVTVE